MPVEARPVYPIRPRWGVAPPFSHAGFLAGDIFLAAMLALLTLLVRWHPAPLLGDLGIVHRIQHQLLPYHSLSDLLRQSGMLDRMSSLEIVIGIAAVAALLMRRWLDAPALIGVALACQKGATRLSQWVQRPHSHMHGIHYFQQAPHHTFAFPSIHVAVITAVYGMLLYLSFQGALPLPRFARVIFRLAILGVLVAAPIGRILEAQELPSDVLGGLMTGGLCLLLISHLYAWLCHRWPPLLPRPVDFSSSAFPLVGNTS